MVFECSDGAFCCIDSVVVWFDKLKTGTTFGNGSLDGAGGFIVEYIEFRLEAAVG
jgi:hypothetical protein